MEVLPPSDGGVVAPVVSHYQGGNIRHHEGDLCQPRGDIKPANNLVAVTVFLLKNMSSDVCREGHLPITETLVVSHNTPQTPLCEVLCATLKLGGGGRPPTCALVGPPLPPQVINSCSNMIACPW